MRAALVDPVTPESVDLFEVSVWQSPDGRHHATLPIPAGTMVGVDAIPAVCDQLKVSVPTVGTEILVLVGPECGEYAAAVRKAVLESR